MDPPLSADRGLLLAGDSPEYGAQTLPPSRPRAGLTIRQRTRVLEEWRPRANGARFPMMA
jgi:hypothetical protein